MLDILKIKFLFIFIIINVLGDYENINYTSDYQIKYDYIAQIEIPKINLKKNLFAKDSFYNNVDINLMLVGDMPSYDTKFIVAGHSGIGSNAYFNDLVYLDINDEVLVYYNNYIYIYEITQIYDILKTGKLYLEENDNGIIVLVTCKINTNLQTIYKGYLKDVKNNA